MHQKSRLKPWKQIKSMIYIHLSRLSHQCLLCHHPAQDNKVVAEDITNVSINEVI